MTTVAPKFEESLKRLTICLQTPLVPGEMEAWVAAVREACDDAGALLRHRIEFVHPAEYAQIVKEDPELFRQVDQMKEGDRQSLEQLEAFAGRLGQLGQAAPRCEPDEQRLDKTLSTLIDNGLALVMHAQKQEVARRTWLVEAFNRERGVGD